MQYFTLKKKTRKLYIKTYPNKICLAALFAVSLPVAGAGSVRAGAAAAVAAPRPRSVRTTPKFHNILIKRSFRFVTQNPLQLARQKIHRLLNV